MTRTKWSPNHDPEVSSVGRLDQDHWALVRHELELRMQRNVGRVDAWNEGGFMHVAIFEHAKDRAPYDTLHIDDRNREGLLPAAIAGLGALAIWTDCQRASA